MNGLPDLPITIPHEKVIEVCRILGVDSKLVRAVSVCRDHVEFDVFRLNERGHMYAVGNEAVSVRVKVPVGGGQWIRQALVDEASVGVC